MMIKFDFDTFRKQNITDEELNQFDNIDNEINVFFDQYKNYMGWYHIDKLFNNQIMEDINATGSYIKDNCDAFIVVGIGGSYLGSQAVIEALNDYYYNQKKSPKIYYLGTSLSSQQYNDFIDLIKEKEIIINVISKSGTTLETTITYELLLKFMKEKYNPEELKNRVIITTDNDDNPLKEDARKYGFKSFIIPSDIGGRYSVFTPAGLLPIRVSNFDLKKLYDGAKEACNNINNQIKYAIIRHLMYKKGKTIEAFVIYEPKLNSFVEWLKQLYAESLGKEEKGILPIGLSNTKDLHSMGQYIQEGSKIVFETIIKTNSNNNMMIDKYNKTLDQINDIACLSTAAAHLEAGVLNNIITIETINEKTIGYLMQFFMISCAISGYIEGVNPFDQEGVNNYKTKIEELL